MSAATPMHTTREDFCFTGRENLLTVRAGANAQDALERASVLLGVSEALLLDLPDEQTDFGFAVRHLIEKSKALVDSVVNTMSRNSASEVAA